MARGSALYDKYPGRRTWLIQRLKKPSAVALGKKRIDQVFAFGGGGSGLSNEAWELLKPCFEFDYMGAAEFEFGALPKSLQPFAQAAEDGEVMADSFVLEPGEIGPRWERKEGRRFRGKHLGDPLPEITEKTVYLLCRKNQREYAEDVVRACAKDDIDLKENSRLLDTLDPMYEYDGSVVGWYELNNGFFFFTDKSMWERTGALFGLDAKEAA